jgi:hypothetical protein
VAAICQVPREITRVTTSLLDVQARWGYSEICDVGPSHFYDTVDGVEALRAKRRAGVAFDQLVGAERQTLASACASIRRNLLVCFEGIERFDLVPLRRNRLGCLLVPPNVWRDSKGRSYPFSHYVMTETDKHGDARRLELPPNGYRMPPDPITVGRFSNHLFLIDGYHRAALFWKYGPPNGTLLAYMPQLAGGGCNPG